MRPLAAAAGGLVAALLLTGAAEGMTVREFLAIADRLPQNASAVLRPDGRRLVNEVTGVVSKLKAEQAADVRAGRRPAHCIPPRGTGISAPQLVTRFRAMPRARRDITVAEAIREWMAERHPCRSVAIN